MSTTTANLQLIKSAVSDNIDQTIGTDLPANFEKIDLELIKRVEKVDGKDLSTNDYSTGEKNKLETIETGATKVAGSTTNGNILINDAEVKAYDDTEVQAELDALAAQKADNTRVDAIITTPVESVSAQEIIDARQGAASLGANLTTVKAQINSLESQKAEKTEVNATNLRVDNLVIPISPENTNIEVTDAHNSIVKNKNFASLKTRLEESEQDLETHKLDYANLVDEVTELAYITQKYTVDSWQKVQDIVRAGLASKAFKIGDQFIANYNSSPFTWDIIGIDHDKPTDTSKEHSLTLQAHDCMMNCRFDAPEALYYAAVELPAGTHKFADGATIYEFTTTQALAIGGQIVPSAWSTEVITQVKTYANATSTAAIETLTVTVSTGAATLAPINDKLRTHYGSNNYAQSAIKQFLNSSAAAFTWTAKSNFDRKPIDAPYTGGGFLKLLDPELVAVLGAVDKQVAKNTVTDGGGQDLFSDKAFLLSRTEIYGTAEGTITGEKAYPWYSALAGAPVDGDSVGRIKYLTGSARFWWLRSPYVGYSYSPRIVNTTGYVNSHYYASIAFGLAPACCIV